MLLLYAAINANLTDEEVVLIAPFLRALYGIRCIFRDFHDMKEARFSALSEKMSESARLRPDCIQIVRMFEQTFIEAGQSWADGAKGLMAEFNHGSTIESKRLSELEQTIVFLFPTLSPPTQGLIQYHWSTYNPKNSGLPYRSLGIDALRTDHASLVWIRNSGGTYSPLLTTRGTSMWRAGFGCSCITLQMHNV